MSEAQRESARAEPSPNDGVRFIARGGVMKISPLNALTRMVAQSTAAFNRSSADGSERVELYEIREDEGYIETFTGLYERLKFAFESRGVSTGFSQLFSRELQSYPDRLSDEDIRYLAERPDQIDVLELIASEPSGFVVQAPTGWGKTFVTRYACNLFRDARIAVVTPGVDLVEDMYSAIKQRIRDVGAVSMRHGDIKRVTVTTINSMEKLRGIDWDLLLFDEVHRAGSPAAANAIASTFHTAKCVGLSASPQHRSDNADLVVEALFGPVKHRTTYNEGVERGAVVPIRAELYKVKEGPDCAGMNGRMRNRHAVWRNEKRNEMIRRVAHSLPAEDQALIIVSTAEHALRLRKMMPEWEVVFSSAGKNVMKRVKRGELPWVEGLKPTGGMEYSQREKLKREFEEGTLRRAIATSVWNTGVDFTQLSWLIRAEGMESRVQAIQTPGRLSRTSDGKMVGHLIDFYDMFDENMRRRANTRRKQYHEMGWDVYMVDVEKGDVSPYVPISRGRRRVADE